MTPSRHGRPPGGSASSARWARTRTARSSSQVGPGCWLRSWSRSSASGHSSGPGRSQPTQGGEGASEGTLATGGASAISSANSPANRSAESARSASWSPPGRYCSAVSSRPSTGAGPARGRGQGKPASASACWTATQPCTRMDGARALTTILRPSVSRRPSTADRWPARNSTSTGSAPSRCMHQAATVASPMLSVAATVDVYHQPGLAGATATGYGGNRNTTMRGNQVRLKLLP